MGKQAEACIEWILCHCVNLYAAEIAVIIVLILYGMMSENGFRAHGC